MNEDEMHVGYFFINADGYPMGNVVSTLDEAEEIARFDEKGVFYELRRSLTNDTFYAKRIYSKGTT